MKKSIKILLWIIGTIVIVFIGIIAYMVLFLPNIPVKEIRVDITPERIERGKYLANHVMVCMDCHSTRDWSLYSGPIAEGTLGKGGETFDQKLGLPGSFISPNLTPYHLGEWSDGEIFRAITTGVSRDGRPLFPIMPYHSYGKASREDIYSVIAYLRQLEPIESETPKPDPDFPMGIIMHLMPIEQPPVEMPSRADKVAYGRYLTTVAACTDCHTPLEKGKPLKEMEFAGGREFPMPFGTLTSSNITPDENTGIGYWNEETFINRFKAFDSISNLPRTSNPKDFNTIMPWNMYANMSEEDLKAIFAYLKSLKPIEHRVVKATFKE